MQALSGQTAERMYAKLCGRKAVLIYVDCNRAVAISAQGFYEVVLRSLLEALADQAALDITATLRAHHQEVTDAATAFNASLSFNLALTDLCEHLGRDLCLLIDEFDELYTALDDRALLNLRALRDRFKDRLGYVTATVRSLPELRGSSVEDEFAEMFARSTYPMPPLEEDEALPDHRLAEPAEHGDQANDRVHGAGWRSFGAARGCGPGCRRHGSRTAFRGAGRCRPGADAAGRVPEDLESAHAGGAGGGHQSGGGTVQQPGSPATGTPGVPWSGAGRTDLLAAV